ncbi:TPA: DUF4158 domain-containing protein [Escherichia coli]|nr:DUF4158 domain-containing protein [Escherichia coli]HCY2090714.1 DUF4158 domain-containing protein [Escherichia coli]HCY3002100.1 DUF4158 domain-containing protein [Escherichia coli]
MAFARAQRRSHNRLGFAIQLALVRALGRTLRTEKLPPKAVITIVAEQLGIDLAVLKLNVTNGAKVVLPQPEWKKMDETFL